MGGRRRVTESVCAWFPLLAAGAGGVHAQAANQDKRDDQHGAGQEENLDLFGHQTDLYSL